MSCLAFHPGLAFQAKSKALVLCHSISQEWQHGISEKTRQPRNKFGEMYTFEVSFSTSGIVEGTFSLKRPETLIFISS
jgi:hypothetical protein